MSGTWAGALDIRQLGDPVLRTVATPVTSFDAALERLVGRMVAAMHRAEGVGLAANQIGVDLAVFVYDVDDQRGVVVNPRPVEIAGELVPSPEGCLSVLGLTFDTPRHPWASVQGQDLRGEPVEVAGEGMLARCLQHETDHLLGRLYLDRLVGEQRVAARQALRAAGAG